MRSVGGDDDLLFEFDRLGAARWGGEGFDTQDDAFNNLAVVAGVGEVVPIQDQRVPAS